MHHLFIQFQLLLKESDVGHASLVVEGKVSKKRKTISVPCLPLSTLFWALNRTRIDYLSLDVEGIEYYVLEGFPFSKFDIRTWSIEQSHTDANGIKDIMDKNSYRFMTHLTKRAPEIALYVDDYIFMKTN